MNCHRARQILALEVGGDGPAHASRVAAHLRACRSCRRVAGELNDNLAILALMRRDGVTEEAVDATHARIMDEIRGPAGELEWWLRVERAVRQGYRPRYAVASLALVVAAVSIVVGIQPAEVTPAGPVVPRASESVPPDTAPALTETLPDDVAPRLADARPTESTTSDPDRTISVLAETENEPPAAAETLMLVEPTGLEVIDLAEIGTVSSEPDALVIKMVTDNPDIVIYWVAGDSETKSDEGGV